MALAVKSSIFGSTGSMATKSSGVARVIAFDEQQQQQQSREKSTGSSADAMPPDASALLPNASMTADAKALPFSRFPSFRSVPNERPMKRHLTVKTARSTVDTFRADSRWKRKHVSIWRALLFLIDCAATCLTLMTVLRENMLIVAATGRYEPWRSRMLRGTMNYNIIRNEVVDPRTLPNLEDIASSWRFYTLPTRNPSSFGDDRSVRMRVNSLSGNYLGIYYDDHWGIGVRREQLFLYSISAWNCDVINFTPQWIATNCTQQEPSPLVNGSDSDYGFVDSKSVALDSPSAVNASRCHRFIFQHFDELKYDRTAQTGVVQDSGAISAPYLRCYGRPDEPFEYLTGQIMYQSYWHGGPFHAELQTSQCEASPVVVTKKANKLEAALYKVLSLDQEAKTVAAFDQDMWLRYFVSLAHSVVCMLMIFWGLLRAILRSDVVRYVPHQARFGRGSFVANLVRRCGMIFAAHFSDDERDVLVFQGVVSLAPAEWMNHWVYSLISIADAIANIRAMGVIFQLSVYMLKIKVTFGNFLFMFSAVTKMTWLVCFLASVLKYAAKVALRVLRGVGLLRHSLMMRVDEVIDASTLFMSYKLYSAMLCLLLALMLGIRKSTTFMVRQANSKRAIYGSYSSIPSFWESEILCDFQVLFMITLLCGLTFSLALVHFTKYRYVARNRVLRALQTRYMVVGWDVFAIMENLGIDPFNPTLVDADQQCAMTNCSYGALLQQFYVSGPSGIVHFAGDSIFLSSPCVSLSRTSTGSTTVIKEAPLSTHNSCVLHYTPYKAMCMGLLDQLLAPSATHNATSANRIADASLRQMSEAEDEATDTSHGRHKDAMHWTTHKFQLHMESLWGKVVLVDDEHRGCFVKNRYSHQFEYVVHDALAFIPSDDRPMLLTYDKRFRVR